MYKGMNGSIYHFGGESFVGSDIDPVLLGNKGANLCRMDSIGMPVPCGFILTTNVFKDYKSNGGFIGEIIWEKIVDAISVLGEKMGARFGSPERPFLVSVRSGAPVSMPGMMDTVLNIGINDEIISGLIDLLQDEKAAYDSYRRLIQMYGNVVKGMDRSVFEEVLSDKRIEVGVMDEREI